MRHRGVRMSRFVQPRAIVQTSRVDDEGVVVLPMADRVAVEARFGSVLDVDGPWQRAAIRPDFAPDALLLVADEDAVRRGAEQCSAAAGDRVREQVARKAERITCDER